MKNKLFFTLVIALMSIYATATEQRLHPVLKYKTINGEKQNHEAPVLQGVFLDQTGEYDSIQQVFNQSIPWQLKAQGVNVDAIPEEEWDGVYERCIKYSYLTDEQTWALGDYIIFARDDQRNAVKTKGRANYPHEKLLVVDFEKVCPSVKGHHQIVICSAVCGNPMYPKNTLLYTTDLSDNTDVVTDGSPSTKTVTDTDEDGSANAQANVTNNIFLPEQSAPAYGGGYQTSLGGYQTSLGSYPTTGYASQCYGYQPSCGSSYGFGLSFAFGFLPVPTIHHFGGNCGQNYNQQSSVTNNYYDYSDHSTHYTDNSYWSWYYNHVHNTTVTNYGDTTHHTSGGPVDPPNGDGLTATDGGPVNPGGRGVRTDFEPLHSSGGEGGRFANETAMVSPRQKSETGNTPIVSNPRQTSQVIAPRKENMTFANDVTPNVNPVQTKTPITPRGVGNQPRVENVTAFNGDVTPKNDGPRKIVTPRNTNFNQNGNGNTFVQPIRNEPRNSGVNQSQPKQYAGTQPRTVQPARTTQPLQPRYQNNPRVSPAPQKVQPQRQYQPPVQRYARQNYARPAQNYSVPMSNNRSTTAMNFSRARH